MRCAFACVVAMLVFGGAVEAQDDPLAHYEAYESAIAEGRTEDAAAAGLAAWRAAEAAWGDTRETAVLAYNVAALDVRLGRPGEAIEPARRALALAEAGVAQGDVPTEDAALVLELAEYVNSQGADGPDRLLATLEARADAPSSLDDLVVLGWISAAHDARQNDRQRQVMQRARRGRLVAERRALESDRLRIEVASLEAFAAIGLDEWLDARVALRSAIDGFPEGDRAATNADLANLTVWDNAAAAVIETRFNVAPQTGSNIRRGNDNNSIGDDEPDDRSESCYSWIEPRDIPTFPADQAGMGRFGAVLMAYDVDRAGRVENVRVAGTAPQNISESFLREIQDAMLTWRATVPSNAEESCLEDQATSFLFVFR